MGFLSGLTSLLGGPIGAIAGAVLPSVVGGIFKKDSEKKQNAANVENTLLQLPRLRQSAEDAGFNPLTALMATGGQGFNVQSTHAPLASASVIQNTVQDVGNVLSGDWARDKKRQEVVDDLNKINLDRALNPAKTRIITQTQRASAPLPHRKGNLPDLKPQAMPATSINTNGLVRPNSRPNLFSNGMTPVIGVDGANKQIPKKMADRLKLQPWDAMLVEDYEAMLGDELGQLVVAPQVPNATVAIEGGLFKQRTAKEREEMLADPWNINKHDEDREGRGERKRRRDKKDKN